jgi:hypothetical protein
MNGSFVKHYSQLVGYTVTGIAVDDSDTDDFGGDPWEGLVMEDGKRKKIAWVLMDPEGNGAGFLDIVDASK